MTGNFASLHHMKNNFRFDFDLSRVSARLDSLITSFKTTVENFVAWYHNMVSGDTEIKSQTL